MNKFLNFLKIIWGIWLFPDNIYNRKDKFHRIENQSFAVIVKVQISWWNSRISMTEKDIVENNLLINNDIFADVVNGTVFHGRDIIQPEELEDADPRSVYTADDGEIHRQERDVLKY